MGTGIERNAAEEGETNSIKDWEKVVVKWHPFNRKLAEILKSMPLENRQGALNQFTNMSSDENEDFMQFLVNLSSLSDQALGRITTAIGNTQKENEKHFRK
jgi:hypothetical protein